ncbi:MAG: GAF domain-containing protein [Gammaproteobacteria bacterium]|nr:GAF domain-containing protein [Gammaproteobacteria bacterium]
MSNAFNTPYLIHNAATKTKAYEELETSVRALLTGETDAIANLANVAALLYLTLPELNWVGFYRLAPESNELVLGPFQGKPACVRIAIGRAVCGTAAARRESVLVKNVHEFPGHIVCDSASNSEIVVPLIATAGPRAGELVGVLDLDSPILERFDDIDLKGLEKIVAVLISSTVWH